MITGQQKRSALWFEVLSQVCARDLRPVIRQQVQVGWEGDKRAERRKQARALMKKFWSERGIHSRERGSSLPVETADESASKKEQQ